MAAFYPLGSFVPNASGNLVNAGGFYLNGYSLANGRRILSPIR